MVSQVPAASVIGVYRPGFPVQVTVFRRERRVLVTDSGAAIALAGKVPGWREVAWELARELDVNVSRQGVVSLPVVPVGPGEEVVVERIASASIQLYDRLLELGL